MAEKEKCDMTNRERRDLGLPYISDEEVFEEQKKARRQGLSH